MSRVGNSLSLRAVNLNLLPVLQALLREQNLVRAADALHLSRPAVSAALAQLRQVLGDPLLVRVGRRMTLTPRAEALVQPVQEACDAMRRVLEGPVFDPTTTARRFVIAASDYAPVLLGAPLQRWLAEQGSGASLHFVNHSADAFDALRDGEIDFAVTPRGVLKALHWPAAHCAALWSETHVLAVRRGHPLTLHPQADDAELLRWPRAVLEPQWYPDLPGFGDFAGGVRLRRDLDEGATLRVEQFCALALLALQSDTVVALPGRLLERVQASLPLARVGPVGQAFEMALAWSALDHDDPAHRWLRGQMLALAGSLTT